ncbi:unnamed protein product [Dracunculus medinensis]|uniref:DUF1508 domain-containing protein n=1 Tax=Dracunculus medinensis TaxID=318479 RepID=A0A0N4UAJ9_DRAME|nr:unnamed protein product [Dracunculus medinensis]
MKTVKGISESVDPDVEYHGGWWAIKDEADLKGGLSLAFESSIDSGCYLAALDNGRFTIGYPHMAGEGPNPEEMLILIKTPDDSKISLKTGYGKYVGVDSEGNLVATADAVGTRERFIFVFQNGKSAILSVTNNLFLSMKLEKDGNIKVVSRKAEEDEMVNIRTNAEKTGPIDWRLSEDKKSAGECEEAYIKMYQHSKVGLKGKQISINIDDKTSVKQAQDEGNLHEILLDRRVKTKSDKYC